jgi:hypothetical protein
MERSRRFHDGVGNKRSNGGRERISPKVMAMVIRNAMAPFVTMLVSGAGASDRIETKLDQARRDVEREEHGELC